MKEKLVDQYSLPKQKPILVVKSSVKAGPPIRVFPL